jgi:hypothetical protein
MSDGWDGIDEAMVAFYGRVPEFAGRGRPPTCPKLGKDWRYLQMVKQRDPHGKLERSTWQTIWGSNDELITWLGKSTV